MNIDWLEAEIEEGVLRIVEAEYAVKRDEILAQLKAKIRSRVVDEWTQAVNRIRKGVLDAVETERSYVP